MAIRAGQEILRTLRCSAQSSGKFFSWARRLAVSSAGWRRVFVILTVTMACSGFVYAGLSNTMPKIFEIGLGNGWDASYTQIGIFVGLVSGLASFVGLRLRRQVRGIRCAGRTLHAAQPILSG